MNHDDDGCGCALIVFLALFAFIIVMEGCSDCGRLQDDLLDLEDRVLLLERAGRG